MDIQKWNYYKTLESKCIEDNFYCNRIVTLIEPLIMNAKTYNPDNNFLSRGIFLQILDDISSMLEHSHSLLKEVIENVDKEESDNPLSSNDIKFKRYDRLNSLDYGYQILFKEISKRKEQA